MSENDLETLARTIKVVRKRQRCRLTAQLPKLPEPAPLTTAACTKDCLVSVLASGSKGNATLVACGRTKILLDAGISCRRITQALRQYGYQLADLDAIFLTHEHSDHVSGLPVLLKKVRVPVYTTAATWQALGKRMLPFQEYFRPLTRRVGVQDLQVVPFAVSHDAARPVGYTILYGQTKITLATDLGQITPPVFQAAAYSDILILEANHDETMLRQGPYPYALQERILSSWGHLSNQAAAELLSSLPLKKQMNVLLAHRSEKNNTPSLSLYTVRKQLAQAGRVVGQDILLRLACQKGSVRYEKGSR